MFGKRIREGIAASVLTRSRSPRKQDRMSGGPTDESALAQVRGDALERMLARLATQRACLDFAAARIAGLPGPVLELGLGKGRTYDRICRIMPDRDIFVFDLDIHCPPALKPPPDKLFLGDFRDTLRAASERLGEVAAMVHADIGSEDQARDARLASDISPLIDLLVRQRGLVLSDRQLPMSDGRWEQLSLPQEAARTAWPYFIWARLR